MEWYLIDDDVDRCKISHSVLCYVEVDGPLTQGSDSKCFD